MDDPDPDVRPDPGGAVRWRVTPALPWLKLAGAGGIALLGAVAGDDPVPVVLAAAVALALVGWAARDLLAPVRVAADADGVTVLSGLSRRKLPWSAVARVRVDVGTRRGLRSELLEVDAGEALYLFGPYDLGAPPAEVAARLDALRRAAVAAPRPSPDAPPAT